MHSRRCFLTPTRETTSPRMVTVGVATNIRRRRKRLLVATNSRSIVPVKDSNAQLHSYPLVRNTAHPKDIYVQLGTALVTTKLEGREHPQRCWVPCLSSITKTPAERAMGTRILEVTAIGNAFFCRLGQRSTPLLLCWRWNTHVCLLGQSFRFIAESAFRIGGLRLKHCYSTRERSWSRTMPRFRCCHFTTI